MHTPGCRYLGDDRFQQALQVGLGMNIMGGDQFKRQQQDRASAADSSSAASPEPRAAPTPKEVRKLHPELCACETALRDAGNYCKRGHTPCSAAASLHHGMYVAAGTPPPSSRGVAPEDTPNPPRLGGHPPFEPDIHI